MNSYKPWIGVDLDGTLAFYDHNTFPNIGEPTPFLEKVRRWVEEGRNVRIMTARVFPITQVIGADLDTEAYERDERRGGASDTVLQAWRAASQIHDWCMKHLGYKLPITCVKDFQMMELYDDRAVQVEENTGRVIGYSRNGLLG